ncbi:hypothetical protein BN1051_00335 [Arthrobacter saudimassiliensis]|uniref:CueP family metal-binding protein n=1 Tax=Arthrobacter saudimassiliensis TaxID=1461584 RepID=A0A078MQA9_9MICC|nr:hypothetical protein BN1051_00335 [Arthrobacter saudimassiliensis]
MRALRLAFSAAALLAATACSSGDGADTVLGNHGLEGTDARQVVEQLDRTNEDRASGLAASVTYDEVTLTDEDGDAVLPLDEFYLAVAPFSTTTHDCFHHSLSGCQGELVNEPLQVRITDDAGDVLVDEAVTTYDNGFVGFWLPKDITGTLEVSSAQGTAVQDFSTSTDSPTCLTTLRLA